MSSWLPAELQPLFTPIDPPGTSPAGGSFMLPGDLDHIGQLQYALVLRGKKRAGKTRLLYKLIDPFAGVGQTVANFSLEIRNYSDLRDRMTEE